MKVIRYVVRMRNGSFMVQDMSETLQAIRIVTVDSPIDADLLKTREVAQRCVDDIPTGNTNLFVIYDKENPPEEVVELEINYQIK